VTRAAGVLAVVAAAGCLLAAQGIRVVDSVAAGLAGDETDHRLAGSGTTTGSSAGRTWRSATGWFSYSLRIYDDSPLTIVCALADGDGTPEAFDVLVDGKKAATFVREPARAKPSEVRVRVGLQDTAGRTSVVVKFAAHPGARTARVLEVRTVQEHLEQLVAVSLRRAADHGGPSR
jgi:uncharacterized protein